MSPDIFLLLTIMKNNFLEEIVVEVNTNDLPYDYQSHWKEPNTQEILSDLIADIEMDDPTIYGVRRIYTVVHAK